MDMLGNIDCSFRKMTKLILKFSTLMLFCCLSKMQTGSMAIHDRVNTGGMPLTKMENTQVRFLSHKNCLKDNN